MKNSGKCVITVDGSLDQREAHLSDYMGFNPSDLCFRMDSSQYRSNICFFIFQ